MKRSINNIAFVSLLPLALLSGCNDNDSSPMEVEEVVIPEPVVYSYEVTVSNLTYGQPLSPVAVVLHDEGQFWQIGESASVALEVLAESGDNSSFLMEENVLAGQSGTGIIMPGMSETIEVSLTDNEPALLSLATMLVNTNDAFTGINAITLTNLPVGESISLTTRSYDAGTEKNSELISTIPGPASSGAGEGFNEIRDDLDMVGMHAGVVSVDDGLSTSVLTQAHKFDNPTLHITINRTN
ncbi:spondin domain-containing protein [Colwellia sp. 1_MG-2023]|uniref:spondin domain-containing protein n=1 Tax=Colwellia sp. 1_MG-2023 TaxID=3062649 RepID=UPI0026E141FE|nr:spondin domain-containing protein [Colwellia sp. 1_MG-2023]MDO6446144.1 spondin domain-containing protein [Colwellia sp. 1_MG-2023]